MNVCLLNDSFPPVIDGVSNTVKNYARVISASESDRAIVATPRYPGADYTGYPYHVIPYRSFDTSALVYGYRTGNPFELKALNEIVAFKPDIIHSHCPVVSTAMARVIREQTGAPIVFTYHTKFDEDIAKAVSSKLLQNAGAKALVDNISACDEVWAVSRGAGENLRSLGYEGDYRVVVNGVDFPRGRTSEEEAFEAAKDYDVPADLPVFLFVGRIMNYKGLPLIIDALSLLADSGQDFRMVFIGGGVDAGSLIERAGERGLTVDDRQEDGSIRHIEGQAGRPGKVIFTGPIRDREVLRAWNTRAHLFLFPSTYDTNGIVVREAAACGLASVLIKDSCAAEDITDGDNGFIIEESPEAMAAVLKAVAADPERARQVGERAMEEIYLSWDDSIHRAYHYYEELLARKAAGELEVKRKKFTDLAVDAAARIDEAGRAIRRASRAVRAVPGEIMESTKRSTMALLKKQKDFYEGVQEKLGSPWGVYEGMLENFVDFMGSVKGSFRAPEDEGFKAEEDESYGEPKDDSIDDPEINASEGNGRGGD